MEINFTIGNWFNVEEDQDGNIRIAGEGNDFNSFELGIRNKFPDRKWFVNLIEEGFKVLNEKEKNKLLKKWKGKNPKLVEADK